MTETSPGPLEVKPGNNVLFGKTVKLTMRVWREKEQRWYDVPEKRQRWWEWPLKLFRRSTSS